MKKAESSSFSDFSLPSILPIPLFSINTFSFNDAVITIASATVCTANYVTTLLNLSAKPDLPHTVSVLQIYLTSLAERGRGSTLVLCFQVLIIMLCGANFSTIRPLAVLLDTPLCYSDPIC